MNIRQLDIVYLIMTATSLEQNKLRRQNGMIAGVCGGLGAFTGLNPLWFRILFLILLLPGGLPGFLPYLAMWLIIPRAERR
ncbi:MAG TPA: PspC domain-containing protein [Acidobacteriota bacterium]|nr:PspC domain-containing protein [Acidobacteriota bacterium]